MWLVWDAVVELFQVGAIFMGVVVSIPEAATIMTTPLEKSSTVKL